MAPDDMTKAQRETTKDSATASLAGTMLDDQHQHVSDEEKGSVNKDVESRDDILRSPSVADEIEAQLDTYPDGGFRAWVVCIGVCNSPSITLYPSHLGRSSA